VLWSAAMSPGRDDARELEPDDGAVQNQASAEPAASEPVAPLEMAAASEPPTPFETAASVQTAPGETAKKRKENSVLSWFLLRSEIATARAEARSMSDEQSVYLQRAKVALEFGNVALEPNNVVASGATAPLAPSLFQQALYWALLMKDPVAGASSPTAAWAAAAPPTLATLASNEADLARIGSAMQATFAELEQGSLEDRRATAELLRRSATRLITSCESVSWQVEWLKLRRLSRIALGVALCLAPFALAFVFWPKKPDLAKGKPWHASSSLAECHPAKSECGGVTTDIFFHTREESNPWFEYDFYAPLGFSSLTIRNRSDCCPERAVPLVVEVSHDDRTFHEIARRNDPFSTWSPHFPTQHARYLRLRTARVSLLHLEAVEVHP
jgi:hypothetical protein